MSKFPLYFNRKQEGSSLLSLFAPSAVRKGKSKKKETAQEWTWYYEPRPKWQNFLLSNQWCFPCSLYQSDKSS